MHCWGCKGQSLFSDGCWNKKALLSKAIGRLFDGFPMVSGVVFSMGQLLQ